MTNRKIEKFKQEEMLKIREQIINFFNGDVQIALNKLQPLMDSDTIRRIFNPKWTKYFSQQNYRRMDWFLNGGQERDAYYNILRRLSINNYSVKTIVDDWSGDYRYFRYYSESRERFTSSYNKGGGLIKIKKENSLPVFEHWSHNYDGVEPEHSGYIYKSDSNVFFLGVGDKKMRLGIAYLVTNPKDEAIVGLVLSQKSNAPYDAFSARFIMVHAENREKISRYSDQTLVEDVNDNSKVLTIGEKNFHDDVGGGEYSYFMLASH